MADQPYDQQRPCLHLEDEDGAQLAIHHRGDKPIGLYLETRAVLPFQGLPIDARVGVYLSQQDIHALLTYLKAEA
jgi:hypothetical protein